MILERGAPQRYSHTLEFTQLDDEPCIVTYDLKTTLVGMKFNLTMLYIPSRTKTAKYIKQGGDFIVTMLKAVVDGKPYHFIQSLS